MTTAGIILIAGVILILVVATIAGVFSSRVVMENPLLTKDVETVVSVSGGDVMVIIIGGNDAADVREIIICIKEVELTENQARQHVCNNTCTFPGVAEGICGHRDISIKGVFSDGVVATLRCSKVECN